MEHYTAPSLPASHLKNSRKHFAQMGVFLCLNEQVKRFIQKFNDAKFLRSFHGYATLVWLVLIPISIFTPLKDSVAWVVLMSVWANFASHWAAWQASRIEAKQDEK